MKTLDNCWPPRNVYTDRWIWARSRSSKDNHSHGDRWGTLGAGCAQQQCMSARPIDIHSHEHMSSSLVHHLQLIELSQRCPYTSHDILRRAMISTQHNKTRRTLRRQVHTAAHSDHTLDLCSLWSYVGSLLLLLLLGSHARRLRHWENSIA